MAPPAPRSRKDARKASRRLSRRVSAVGIAGELLITAGFLVFLFLGWQLWLNDIIVGDQQNHVSAKIAQSWDQGNSTLNVGEKLADYGEPIVDPAPATAETFAIMYVPRFGADWTRQIAEGVGLGNVLNTDRIGHYPGTQMPGEVGNFAIAGHRTTYGAPFNGIDQLTIGDRLYLRTQEGYYTYVFRNLEYVSKQGIGVIDPVPQLPSVEATQRLMTMTSCNPKLSSAERIIAYSLFESWQPASAGPPAEIAPFVNAKG